MLRPSSADSTVYLRPTGLQLQESAPPVTFDIARLFADVDDCDTMLAPQHCSLNLERLTLSANSSDTVRVVALVTPDLKP